MPRTKKNF